MYMVNVIGLSRDILKAMLKISLSRLSLRYWLLCGSEQTTPQVFGSSDLQYISPHMKT